MAGFLWLGRSRTAAGQSTLARGDLATMKNMEILQACLFPAVPGLSFNPTGIRFPPPSTAYPAPLLRRDTTLLDRTDRMPLHRLRTARTSGHARPGALATTAAGTDLYQCHDRRPPGRQLTEPNADLTAAKTARRDSDGCGVRLLALTLAASPAMNISVTALDLGRRRPAAGDTTIRHWSPLRWTDSTLAPRTLIP